MSALHPAVLVIDDDPHVQRYLRQGMIAVGYRLTEIGGGDFQLDLLVEKPPDAVVLDLYLRDRDGVSLLKIIRAHFDGPIIILSTPKREIDLIEALNCGADNFVAKPFFTEELLARLRVVVRRRLLSAGRKPLVKAKGLEIDLVNRIVTADRKTVVLSEPQYSLLSKLAEAGGGVVPYQAFFQGETALGAMSLQTLRSLVRQLRDKIEANPRTPLTIKTVNCVGYKLALENEP